MKRTRARDPAEYARVRVETARMHKDGAHTRAAKHPHREIYVYAARTYHGGVSRQIKPLDSSASASLLKWHSCLGTLVEDLSPVYAATTTTRLFNSLITTEDIRVALTKNERPAERARFHLGRNRALLSLSTTPTNAKR